MRGVLFVNDSKATNVAAARRGIEAFPGGVHVILGGSLKGGGFRGLREAVAARCRAAYLIGAGRRGASARPRRHRAAAPLRRSGDGGGSRGPSRRARRGGAALPGLRELRPVPRLRGTGRAVQTSAAGGMIPPPGVEGSPDACACRPQATGRVLDPLHSHAVPARLRRGDGLLGQLGRVAPQRHGRPCVLPQALRALRDPGPGRAARRLAARPEAHQGAHAAAADRLVRPHRRGDGAARGGAGERRHALARGGPAPVPALGAAEALAGALRRPDPVRAAAPDQDAQGAGQPAPDRGGVGVPDPPEAARHGHGDGDLLLDRGVAGGGRGAEAEPGHHRGGAGGGGAHLRRGRALPAGPAHVVHRSLRGCRRQRLPGGSGAHGAGLGRDVRGRPGGIGAEDLLPARGPHGHDPGHHRRGARPGGDHGRDLPLRDDRLRGPAHGQDGPRPALAPAGRRDHLADPVPGHAQFLRGAGDGAAHRGAAALSLLRQHQPGGADGRHGPAAERGRHGWPPGAQREASTEAIEGGRDAQGRDRRRRDGGSRRAGARGR